MSKHHYKNSLSYKRYLANAIKVNYKEQEYFLSSVLLVIKVCFSLLAVVSLLKLGFSSKVRLARLREIQDSYLYEKSRFKALTSRFDYLFSLKGEQRFMKDQDQMISRDVIRVIWRR